MQRRDLVCSFSFGREKKGDDLHPRSPNSNKERIHTIMNSKWSEQSSSEKITKKSMEKMDEINVREHQLQDKRWRLAKIERERGKIIKMGVDYGRKERERARCACVLCIRSFPFAWWSLRVLLVLLQTFSSFFPRPLLILRSLFLFFLILLLFLSLGCFNFFCLIWFAFPVTLLFLVLRSPVLDPSALCVCSCRCSDRVGGCDRAETANRRHSLLELDVSLKIRQNFFSPVAFFVFFFVSGLGKMCWESYLNGICCQQFFPLP